MTSRVSRRNTLNRQVVGLSLALGATTAMATFTGGALLADIALLVLCLATRRRPPAWVWLVALPIGVTSFWASTWWVPLWTAARVVGLGVVFAGWRPRISMVAAGYCTMLLAQTMGLLVVMEHYRPAGYTDNASVLGQAGLTALMLAPVAGLPIGLFSLATGGITLGVSLARAPLMALVVLAFCRPGWRAGVRGFRRNIDTLLPGVGVLGVMVIVVYAGGIARFGDPVRASLEERNHLLGVFAIGRHDGNVPPLTLWGYGYDSFVTRTGHLRPHALPVVAVYELGILALPVFGALGWALWTRRLPLTFALVMAPLWLFTDEQWSHPGGHYMLAVMALTAVALKQQGHKTTADYVRAVGVWLHTAASRLNRKGQSAGEHQGDPHKRPA